MPTEDGLKCNKFRVERTDGKDQPGGPKENARYFVLDYMNDPYARDALMRYIQACNLELPELARDLRDELAVAYEAAETSLLGETARDS